MFRNAHRAALVAGVTLALLAAPSAQAQWTPSLVVKAGASLPIGDWGEVVKTGYHVGVGAEFAQRLSPLGFRLELDFNENAIDDLSDDDFRTVAGLANVLYSPSQASGVYFIGGAGFYRFTVNEDNDVVDSGSETNVGINGGAGLRFGLTGFSTFVEARLHHVFTDGDRSTQFIPVVFGVRF